MLNKLNLTTKKFNIAPELNKKDIKILKRLQASGIGPVKPTPLPLWQIARDMGIKYESIRYSLQKLLQNHKIERYTYYSTNKKGKLRKHSSYKLI